jgi:kynurenine formamidase
MRHRARAKMPPFTTAADVEEAKMYARWSVGLAIGWLLVALPMKIAGGTGGPLRAVALLPP